MKKLPKKVTILGRVFTVKLVSQEILLKETGVEAVGGCNYTKRLILIKKGMTWDDTFVTFLHECVHVGTFVSGLNQITNGLVIEVWCETMANTFRDIFK